MLLNTHRRAPVLDVIPQTPTARLTRLTPAVRMLSRPVEPAGSFHYHGIPPPARIPWLALVLSAAVHAVVILGFNGRVVVRKHAVAEEAPTELLMMPDLSEPDEVKPQELNDDDPIAAPAVQVPMLADVPLSVPNVASFTQLIDVVPPVDPEALAKGLSAIPVNIQHGRPDSSRIKDLFNLADLDRPPEPIVQTPPRFPYELQSQVSEAHVRVGFIVTSKGDVIMPYIVSSSHHDVERPALEAVAKWKFRPGIKNGRKVNTRVEQPIKFTVSDD